MDLVPKEEPLSLTEAVTCSDLQDYSTASFCAFIFKARNFSQKDCTMFTIIMQEWKAIKLSNKKKLSLNSESLFTVTSILFMNQKNIKGQEINAQAAILNFI